LGKYVFWVHTSFGYIRLLRKYLFWVHTSFEKISLLGTYIFWVNMCVTTFLAHIMFTKTELIVK